MSRPLLRWLPALVIASTVLYTMSVYPTLPARMPTHWGINGHPNAWSPRELGAWILPGMMTFLWLLFLVIPKVGVALDVVSVTTISFMAVVQRTMLHIALGRPVEMNTVIFTGLGILFIVLGLAMPHTTPNPYFGVRTRATMSDPAAWARSNEKGGKIMVLAGFAMILVALWYHYWRIG